MCSSSDIHASSSDARGHGQVDREALARAAAYVMQRPGPGEDAGLMDAGEEDGVARAEDVVGAVPVMDVPVEDEDPAGAERVERVLRRYRDVVEEAEARRRLAARVVTGWACRAEARASLAGHERVGHRARPARGVQRGAIGPRAQHRLVVQAAAARALGAHGSST